MAVTTVQVPMDTELNERFSEVCHSLGMTVGGAFNIFARQMVQDHGFPLGFRLPEEPNEESMKAIEDIEKGRNVEHFDSAQDALASLGLV